MVWGNPKDPNSKKETSCKTVTLDEECKVTGSYENVEDKCTERDAEKEKLSVAEPLGDETEHSWKVRECTLDEESLDDTRVIALCTHDPT